MGNMSVTCSHKVLKRLMIMNVWVSVSVCVMCVEAGGEEEEERKNKHGKMLRTEESR